MKKHVDEMKRQEEEDKELLSGATPITESAATTERGMADGDDIEFEDVGEGESQQQEAQQ